MVRKHMTEIAISKFKATCLAILERVSRTGETVIVTRRGVPIAEIKPPPKRRDEDWIGSMAGTAEQVGDIVDEPAEPEGAWEVLK